MIELEKKVRFRLRILKIIYILQIRIKNNFFLPINQCFSIYKLLLLSTTIDLLKKDENAVLQNFWIKNYVLGFCPEG